MSGTPPLAFTFGLGAQLLFPMRTGASVVFFSGSAGPRPDAGPDRRTPLHDAVHRTDHVSRARRQDLRERQPAGKRSKQCVSAGETLAPADLRGLQGRNRNPDHRRPGLHRDDPHFRLGGRRRHPAPAPPAPRSPATTPASWTRPENILEPPCEGLLATRGTDRLQISRQRGTAARLCRQRLEPARRPVPPGCRGLFSGMSPGPTT